MNEEEMKENTKKENLVEIIPLVFLVRTQAGYRKLIKRFHLAEDRLKGYTYSVSHFTASGVRLKDNRKNYPIKYPCIIAMDDETFEIGHVYLSIRYIVKNQVIEELTPISKNKNYE